MKITFDLSDEFQVLLAELCREEGLTAGELARRLLLDRLEDFEDVRLAEARLGASGGHGIKLEDVMRDFGLVDEKGVRIKPAAE